MAITTNRAYKHRSQIADQERRRRQCRMTKLRRRGALGRRHDWRRRQGRIHKVPCWQNIPTCQTSSRRCGSLWRDGLAISYTQWEAWLALYPGKLLVIAKADDAAPRGPKYAPTDDSRAAQQGGTFTGPDNLAKLVLSGAILELLATADNRRIKIRTAVVAVPSWHGGRIPRPGSPCA
jgi:hypothetical protein